MFTTEGFHCIVPRNIVDYYSLSLAQVPLRDGVERWTASLLSSCQSSLQQELGVATSPGSGASVEEWAYQRVTQVASMALFCQWTRDCEQVQLGYM